MISEEGVKIGYQIATGYEGLGGLHPDGKYYPYQGKADKKDVWTEGRGHVCSPEEVQRWMKSGLSMSEVEALFIADMKPRMVALDKLCRGKYTAQQFGAMLSMFYNYELALAPGHSLGDAHRKGDIKEAAKAFLLYILDGNRKKCQGLYRRRMSEALCYLTGKVLIAKCDATEKALEAELRKHIEFTRPKFES